MQVDFKNLLSLPRSGHGQSDNEIECQSCGIGVTYQGAKFPNFDVVAKPSVRTFYALFDVTSSPDSLFNQIYKAVQEGKPKST